MITARYTCKNGHAFTRFSDQPLSSDVECSQCGEEMDREFLDSRMFAPSDISLGDRKEKIERSYTLTESELIDFGRRHLMLGGLIAGVIYMLVMLIVIFTS